MESSRLLRPVATVLPTTTNPLNFVQYATGCSFETFFLSLNRNNVSEALRCISGMADAYSRINTLTQVHKLTPVEYSTRVVDNKTHYECPLIHKSGIAQTKAEAKYIIYSEIDSQMSDLLKSVQFSCPFTIQEKLYILYESGFITNEFIETKFSLVDHMNRRVLFGGSDKSKSNEQLARKVAPKQYTFTIAGVLKQALVKDVPTLPSFHRTMKVSQQSVAYFLSQIKTSLYLDVNYEPTDEQELLITLCHMIHHMYLKGMWRHTNTPEELHSPIQVALKNWSNGTPLMTFQRVSRKAVKPYNTLNKATKPYFDFLSFFVRKNDPTNLLVNQVDAQFPGLTQVHKYASNVISATTQYLSKKLLDKYLESNPMLKTAISMVEYVHDIYINLRDALIRAIQPMLDKIRDPDSGWSVKIKRALIAAVSYIGLSFVCRSLSADNVKMLITIILPSILTTYVAKEFAEDVIEFILSYLPQELEDDECRAQISFTALQPIIAIMTSVMHGTVDLAALRDFNIRATTAKNATEMIKYIILNFKDLVDFCYSAFTGKPFFAESEMLASVRAEFEIWDMYMTQESIHAQFVKDPAKLQEIIDFNTRLQNLDKQVRVSRVFTEVEQRRWAVILSTVKQWANSAHVLKANQSTRQAPVWINLVGIPGTGKTTLINILASAVRHLSENKPFTAGDRYERQPNKTFWDGYKAQWLVTLDDIYQTCDVVTRLGTSMDFISMINCNPLPLNMASLEKKEDTMFTSKLVISTTNTHGLPTDLGITCPDALVRRCSLNVTVKRLGDIQDITHDNLIKNWSFELMNKFGSSVVTKALSFTEFVNLVVAHLDKEKRISEVALAPPDQDFWSGKLVRVATQTHVPQPEAAQPPRSNQPPAPKPPGPVPPQPRPPPSQQPPKPRQPPSQQPPRSQPPKSRPPPKAQQKPQPKPESQLRESAPPFVPQSQVRQRKPTESPPGVQSPNQGYKTQMYTNRERKIDVFNKDGEKLGTVSNETTGGRVESTDYLYHTIDQWVNYPYTFVNHMDITGKWSDLPGKIYIAPTGPPVEKVAEILEEDVESPEDDLIQEEPEEVPLIPNPPPVPPLLHVRPLITPPNQVLADHTPTLASSWWTGADVPPRGIPQEHFVFDTIMDPWLPEFAYVTSPEHRDYFIRQWQLGLTKRACDVPIPWYKGMFSRTLPLQRILQRVVFENPDKFIQSVRYFQTTGMVLSPAVYAWLRLNRMQKGEIDIPGALYWTEFDRITSDDGFPSFMLYFWYLTFRSAVISISLSMAVSYLFWMAIDAIFGTNVASQSADKTQKNIARSIYARNFWGAYRAKVNGTYKQPRYRGPAPKDFSKGKMRKADARLNKEAWNTGDWELQADEENELVEVEAHGPSVHTSSLVNRVCLNTIEIEITYSSGASFVTNMFFVRGTQGFAVKHAFEATKSDTDRVTMISLFSRAFQRGSIAMGENQFKIHKFENRDLVRVTFDSACPSFRDLSAHLKAFVPDTVCERPGRVSWTPIERKGEMLEVRQVEFGTQALARSIPMNTISEHKSFVNTQWYEVSHLTGAPGLCGYVLVNDVEADQTPILGIHVGGKADKSMIVPITPDDVEYIQQFYMSNIPKADEVVPDEASLVKFDTRGIESDVVTVCNVVPYKGEGLRVIHNLRTKPFMPTENPIKPSPFQKTIVYKGEQLKPIHEPTYLPVRLKSVDPDKPSPYNVALDKVANICVPPLSQHIKDMMKDPRMDELCYGKTLRTLERRRLTEKEVIFGVPELGIPSMDLTTGIGPPECTLGQKTSQMIKVDHKTQTYEFHPQFKKRLDYIEKQSRSKIVPHLCLDMLKIETREKERVFANKTRLFEAGSKASIFLWKRLTGHLLAHVEKYRNEHWIKIGINVHSTEWVENYKQITRFLSSRKDKGVLGGDFAQFDKSLILEFSEPIADGIIRNIGYAIEEWEEFFIRCFVHGTLQAIHFSPIGLYETFMGNSSGGPATSWFNSIINVIVHGTAFNCLVPERAWLFTISIWLAIYGDDSHGSVSVEIRELYNMKTLQVFILNTFGMHYTSCTKGETVETFTDLDDSDFLCRKYAEVDINGNKYILPQLREESIKNSVLWLNDPSSPMCHKAFEQTVGAALSEWSYYGPDVHTRYRNEYLKRMNGIGHFPSYPSFNDHKTLWHMYSMH